MLKPGRYAMVFIAIPRPAGSHTSAYVKDLFSSKQGVAAIAVVVGAGGA